MSNTWAFDLESKFFSIIKTKANKQLSTKYPNINFTTTNMNQNEAVFPTVYIHELSGLEMGNDLENKTINAVMETLQIEVTTDTSQKDAKYIMAVIADILKGMSFNITEMPEFNNGTTTYRLIMRARRIVGSGDII